MATVALKSYTIISDEYENEYDVEILDTQDVYSSAFRFNIGTDFSLNYNSQSDDRFSPIKGSDLSLPIIIQNASQQNLIINQMLNSVDYGEDRWIVKVNKNGSLFWVGVVVFDLWQRSDMSYPYTFNLAATDGLARLKELEFTSMLNNDIESIGSIIRKVLLKTPLYQVLNTGDAFYSNSINWYDNNMPAVSSTTDPFEQTFIRRWALVDIDNEDTNNNKAISYYESLETLLLQFNARILLSDGIFRIVTINLYEKSNILYERVYDDSGTYLSTSSPSWSTNINQSTSWVVSGQNQWQYYPAIRSINRRYYLGKSSNLLNPSAGITTAQSFNDQLGGDVLRFQSYWEIITTAVTTVGALATQTIIMEFKIKCGSYYLRRAINSNTATWTTTSTDRYFVGVVVQLFQTKFNLSFTTPPLPSGTHTACEIQLVSYVSNLGNSITLPSLQLYLDNGSNDEWKNYSGCNTSGYINSKTYDLPDARIGKGPFYASNGAIFTGSSLGTAALSSDTWSVDKTGPTYDINELLVIEIFAGQSVPSPKYQGEIRTDASPHFKLNYNSEAYIINGVSYSLLTDTYSGEWFKIQLNTTNYNSVEDGDGNAQGEVLYSGESIGNTQFTIRSTQEGVTRYNNERKLAQVNSDITGTVTSITVTPLTQVILQGDKLYIIPILGEEIYLVEASADAAISDTTINISSFTPSETIETGASVVFPFQSPVINYLRLDDSFPTSDPGIVGVAWHDTSNHNIKISNG